MDGSKQQPKVTAGLDVGDKWGDQPFRTLPDTRYTPATYPSTSRVSGTSPVAR